MRHQRDQIRREALILADFDDAGGFDLSPAPLDELALLHHQRLPRVTLLIALIPLVILIALPDHTQTDHEHQRGHSTERSQRRDQRDALHYRRNQEVDVGVALELEKEGER